MKKFLRGKIAWVLVMILVLSMMTACGSGSEPAKDEDVTMKYVADSSGTGSEAVREGGSSDSVTEESAGYDDASGGTVGIVGDGGGGWTGTFGADESDGFAADDAEFSIDGGREDFKLTDSTDSTMDESGEEVPADTNQITVQPGVLTAGEWNDNNNWGYYKNLFSKDGSYGEYKKSFGMDFTNRLKVTVKDNGKAVALANVKLMDTDGKVSWSSYTNANGEAYLFFNVTAGDKSVPAQIVAEKGGKSQTQKLDVKVNEAPSDDLDDPNGTGGKISLDEEYEIELEDKAASKKLDLMFMIDTTGSMGDEITYLQEELKDVVSRVKRDNGNLPIRISMNFYRDNEDVYVVKSNDFTEDVNEAQRQLNAEYADGGGDYPEAVDKALENAVEKHAWDSDSVKVMILVLDAPPHEGTGELLYKEIANASSKGIRIIPVASSGVDKETEFFLRAASIATGGTYTFLTDHSGVGGSHIEPTIGDYEVEKLNDLLVRVIGGYIW